MKIKFEIEGSSWNKNIIWNYPTLHRTGEHIDLGTFINDENNEVPPFYDATVQSITWIKTGSIYPILVLKNMNPLEYSK